MQHLDGEVFVTTRIYGSPVPNRHYVSVFDSTGTWLRTWLQPGFAQTSDWGFRDGATDGTSLFFGHEFGIQIVDIDGIPLDGSTGPNIQTANGPRTHTGGLISGNVLNPGAAGMVRGRSSVAVVRD